MDQRRWVWVWVMVAVCTSGCALTNEVNEPDVLIEDDASEILETDDVIPLGFGSCESDDQCSERPNAQSVCIFGGCALECRQGFADCDRDADNGCEQSITTSSNCGGCDQPCEPPKALGSCVDGVCAIAACSIGFGDCDGLIDNGCETLTVTPTNCGECGVACEPPNAVATCDGGDCGFTSCQAGFADCDDAADNGCEVALNTTEHCGACGVACQPGQSCSAQGCIPVVEFEVALPFTPQGLGFDDVGGFWLAGWADTTFEVGGEMIDVSGDDDGVILRLNAEAQHLGMTRLTGPGSERITHLVTNAAGDAFIAGAAEGAATLGDVMIPHTGGGDVVLGRLGGDMTTEWALAMGGPGPDAPSTLALLSSSELLVGGGYSSPATFGGEVFNSGTGGAFLAQFSSAGLPQWSMAFPGQDGATVEVVSAGEATAGTAGVLLSANGLIDGLGQATPDGTKGVWLRVDSEGEILEFTPFEERPRAGLFFAEGTPIVALERDDGTQHLVSLGPMGEIASIALEIEGDVLGLKPALGTSDFYLLTLHDHAQGLLRLARHRATGELLWRHEFNGESDRVSFEVHADGRVLIAGASITLLSQ